jgi:hypothetical protein
MRGFDNNAAAARMFGAAPGAEPADAAMRRRRSVLDLVQADMTRLRARLGGDERATLETHLESFRELARRVAQPPAAVCDPAAFDRRGYVNNPGDGYPPTYHRTRCPTCSWLARAPTRATTARLTMECPIPRPRPTSNQAVVQAALRLPGPEARRDPRPPRRHAPRQHRRAPVLRARRFQRPRPSQHALRGGGRRRLDCTGGHQGENQPNRGCWWRLPGRSACRSRRSGMADTAPVRCLACWGERRWRSSGRRGCWSTRWVLVMKAGGFDGQS